MVGGVLSPRPSPTQLPGPLVVPGGQRCPTARVSLPAWPGTRAQLWAAGCGGSRAPLLLREATLLCKGAVPGHSPRRRGGPRSPTPARGDTRLKTAPHPGNTLPPLPLVSIFLSSAFVTASLARPRPAALCGALPSARARRPVSKRLSHRLLPERGHTVSPSPISWLLAEQVRSVLLSLRPGERQWRP